MLLQVICDLICKSVQLAVVKWSKNKWNKKIQKWFIKMVCEIWFVKNCLSIYSCIINGTNSILRPVSAGSSVIVLSRVPTVFSNMDWFTTFMKWCSVKVCHYHLPCSPCSFSHGVHPEISSLSYPILCAHVSIWTTSVTPETPTWTIS